MRIGVAGGREFRDAPKVTQVIQVFDRATRGGFVPKLVHGGARGADSLAAQIADSRGWWLEEHPAEWTRYGLGAGPIRNQAMCDSGLDVLVALPGGAGTADMTRRARAAGILVLTAS